MNASLNTQKWHHLHNSFLFMRSEELTEKPSAQKAALLLNGKADGLVMYSTHSGKKLLKMDAFFNEDGSYAQYCGNAHICLATMAHQQNFESAHFDRFRITVSDPGENKLRYELTPFDWKTLAVKPVDLPHGLKGECLTFGVPHTVFFEDHLHRTDIISYKKYTQDVLDDIQNDPQFPEGINVTFIFTDNQGSPQGSLSYERGLRRFSNACSSGIFASIVLCLQKGLLIPKTRFGWQAMEDSAEFEVLDHSLVIYSRAYEC